MGCLVKILHHTSIKQFNYAILRIRHGKYQIQNTKNVFEFFDRVNSLKLRHNSAHRSVILFLSKF